MITVSRVHDATLEDSQFLTKTKSANYQGTQQFKVQISEQRLPRWTVESKFPWLVTRQQNAQNNRKASNKPSKSLDNPDNDA